MPGTFPSASPTSAFAEPLILSTELGKSVTHSHRAVDTSPPASQPWARQGHRATSKGAFMGKGSKQIISPTTFTCQKETHLPCRCPLPWRGL